MNHYNAYPNISFYIIEPSFTLKSGEITFEEKALNCEKSGGLAAIIYNSEDGPFAGTLTMDTKATIPVVGIPKEAGEDIIMNYLGMPANLLVLVGYGYADGTSMVSKGINLTICSNTLGTVD